MACTAGSWLLSSWPIATRHGSQQEVLQISLEVHAKWTTEVAGRQLKMPGRRSGLLSRSLMATPKLALGLATSTSPNEVLKGLAREERGRSCSGGRHCASWACHWTEVPCSDASNLLHCSESRTFSSRKPLTFSCAQEYSR